MPERLLAAFARQPEGWLLRQIFRLMLAFSLVAIGLDAAGMMPAEPGMRPRGPVAPQPVPLERPGADDHLRPYLPDMRPAGPDGRPARPVLPDGRPLPQPELRRMELSLEETADGLPFILGNGDIETGMAEELRRFDRAHGLEAVHFVIVSNGGYTAEAEAMGRYLRDRGMTVVVPRLGWCLSACPLVLAGGATRLVHPEAWIGVHQAYLAADARGPAQAAFAAGVTSVARTMRYLEEMGIDPLLWRLASEIPPQEIYLLTAEELQESRLATRLEAEIRPD